MSSCLPYGEKKRKTIIDYCHVECLYRDFDVMPCNFHFSSVAQKSVKNGDSATNCLVSLLDYGLINNSPTYNYIHF